MGDQFGYFLPSDAVLKRELQMKWQFVYALAADQCCDRNQASIAKRKIGTLPDIAEQQLVGIFGCSHPAELEIKSIAVRGDVRIG